MYRYNTASSEANTRTNLASSPSEASSTTPPWLSTAPPWLCARTRRRQGGVTLTLTSHSPHLTRKYISHSHESCTHRHTRTHTHTHTHAHTRTHTHAHTRTHTQHTQYTHVSVKRGPWVAGTCRMGPRGSRAAVVDDQLRVHGLRGIRVVGSAVAPGGDSCATCIQLTHSLKAPGCKP